MGEFMFGNEFFDHWLGEKTKEILQKVDREKISTEEMLILSLKAQTNHFHHMDEEFRDEFRGIKKQFEFVDKRFERLSTILMWSFGLIMTSLVTIILKLFI